MRSLLVASLAAAASVMSAMPVSSSSLPILDFASSPSAAAAAVASEPHNPQAAEMRFRTSTSEEPAKPEAAASPTPTPAPVPFKPASSSDRYSPTCDLAADSSICLFGGKKVILPDAAEKRLVGWYSFDSSHVVDASGYQNHGSAVVPPGPGRLGRGASAYFDGDVWMEVPQSDSLGHAARRATASFWVYLRPDTDFGTDLDCSMVLLGGPEGAAWQVGFNPKQRVLTAAAHKGRAKLRSFAKLRVAQWTHVALVVDGSKLTLYVNGIPDATAPIDAAAVGAAGAYPLLNLYSGRIPFESNLCHAPMLVDDLRVYARAVNEYEITAQSFGALGAVEPAYVRLGKVDASFDEAQAACKEPYHLCVQNDLYAGAIQTARTMGWGKPSDQFWVGAAKHTGKPDEKRIALCCNEA